MDYSDLKNKTFLDFTDDESIIEEILGFRRREYYIADLSMDMRYSDILELAKLTNNKELEAAAEEQFKDPSRYDDWGNWSDPSERHF